MSKTLIILNPHARSGRAGQLWTRLEPLLWDMLGELVVAVTQRPQDVAQHLENAYQSGLTRVISIGGDGTNHALINELAALNERHPDGPPMVYGTLPIGTGADWARGMGMPYRDVEAAARWIASAQPKATDVGVLDYDGQREHFLNIASAGIGSDVAKRVNRTAQRRSWSYMAATVSSLLSNKPQPMQITLDGQPWYEGNAFAVAVANGTTFGHGMKIAPHAETDDGLFDVVLIKGGPLVQILPAIPLVFSGSHLSHPCVRYERAKRVEVSNAGQPLGLELDGEPFDGRSLTFEIRPGLLHLLSASG